jgi:hypothetical protein
VYGTGTGLINRETWLVPWKFSEFFYNYCEAGDDKRTPAMRLGLAKGIIAPEDVLYFVASDYFVKRT